MAASSGATDLQLYGSRKQMHRIPPSFQPRSDRWTLLYLVSPPLPPNISVLRFEIVSHDQGWCSRPQDGSWSWFEVSILGSWQENAKPDFSNLNDAIYLKSYPDDFGMMIQEQGLYFKEIPTKGNEGRMDPSSAISLQFAKNSIQPEWKHQAVVWTRRDSDTKGARFLSVLEEGDRLAIWVRVQFPGWENFVKEARISLSTTAERSSERQYDTSPSMPTEIERRQVEGSISHDNIDDRSSVTRANKNPEESIRIVRQNTNLDPQHIKESENLEEAIQVCRQAVAATPKDHPNFTGRLNNLGNKLQSRYKRTGQMGDLEQAIRVSRQAFQSKLAPPLDRINAATLALRLLIEREDYHGGYALSVEAIDLLQLVHKRSLTLQDQQYVVSYFSGLATHACSLAIKTRQPLFEALRLLESGRAVILSLLMNDRSDTSKLKEAHPILCARYESLRLEVNAPKSTTAQQTDAFVSTRRPKATEELEECLQDIRNLPGFDSFQRGLTTKQMQNSSNQGSIIVVNVTGLQSDAIIVSPTGFSLVPLPRFSAVQAQSWVDQKLTLASPSERGMKNKSYRQFLAWLWRECVKPILTELGHSVQSSLENLPRVWWIGTGLASSFPFHAACDISAGQNTLCRVLSSYTPSIQALLHARERVSISTPSNENPSTLLMVTMSNTPGADDLPGVKAERYTVLGALGSCVQVKTLDQPDAASVMHQIRECNIAHFACHGTSNSRDPSQSGLLLQTTTANPRQDILSVLKLCENHPTLGEIAYLSACSTAENQAEDLIDEVLHVVSGFQVAGFRHVIGTLWPSDDSVCVEVARSFYAELCRNGSLEYTDRTIAVALHKAVSAVSTSVDYGKRPLHWAQYVHYGA